MKITRLQLRNFMSWKHTDIELPDGVVAMVGPNGAGKSSVLEAITWALWGKSRIGQHNNLIYRGRGKCAVSVDFSVSGRDYRVTRRRNLSGRGSSSLELLDVTDDKPLSSQTIKETQESVDDLVGISYDLFMSSVMMAQGDASRFSSATPGERKELMYQMLGLQWFEELESKARALTRVIVHNLNDSQSKLETRESDLESIKWCEKELAREKESLAKIIVSLSHKGSELDDTVSLLRDIEKHSYDRDRYSRDKESARVAAASTHDRMVDIKGELSKVEYIIASEDQVTEVYMCYITLKERESDMASARNDYEKLLSLRAKLDSEREALEKIARKRPGLLSSIDHLECLILDLENSKSIKLKEIDDLNRQAGLHTAHAQDATERASDYAVRATLHSQMHDELTNNLDKLAAGTCPTCNQSVDDEDIIARLKEKADTEKQLADINDDKMMDENKRRLEATRSRDECVSTAKELIKEVEDLNGRIIREEARLSGDRDDLATCEDAEEKLRTDNYGSHIRQEMSKLGDIEFDPDEYQSIRDELEKYSGADVDFSTLNDAKRRLPLLEAQLDRESRLELEQIETMEGFAARVREEDEWLSGYNEQEIEDNLAAIKREISDLEYARSGAEVIIGGLQTDVDRYRSLLKEIECYESLVKRYKHERDIANLLVDVSCKTGAPALIIELALPLIENVANRILDDLSPGTSISLRSQRDTISGSTRETLDIIVYSGGFEVPLETLSGGERLRADLAIRLAMGDVMASRASSSPTMLFIDEGFGSQDPDGQQAIVDAISALYSMGRFDLILVITHVPAIASSFDTILSVSKTNDGSEMKIG